MRPNLLGPVIVQASLGIGGVILAKRVISFTAGVRLRTRVGKHAGAARQTLIDARTDDSPGAADPDQGPGSASWGEGLRPGSIGARRESQGEQALEADAPGEATSSRTRGESTATPVRDLEEAIDDFGVETGYRGSGMIPSGPCRKRSAFR